MSTVDTKLVSKIHDDEKYRPIIALASRYNSRMDVEQTAAYATGLFMAHAQYGEEGVYAFKIMVDHLYMQNVAKSINNEFYPSIACALGSFVFAFLVGGYAAMFLGIFGVVVFLLGLSAKTFRKMHLTAEMRSFATLSSLVCLTDSEELKERHVNIVKRLTSLMNTNLVLKYPDQE